VVGSHNDRKKIEILLMELTLQQQTIEAEDALAVQELFFQNEWTDGLPVVPPTKNKIEAMLNAVPMDPQTIIGAIPERGCVFTLEVAAINSVMAGCLPEYFPVVVTAVSAISDPAFGLHGPSASTHGPAILIIVNGPVTKSIGLNHGQNLFGPGVRANSTIGRAVRLILLNAGGTREFDRSTLGHGGKFSYCIAENETTEWLPLHVQKGYDPQSSSVTVFAGEAPNQFQNHTSQKAESILLTLADRMSALGTFNINGHSEMAVILCPEHYYTCRDQGWNKKKIQDFLQKNAFRNKAELIRGGVLEEEIKPGDEQERIHTVKSAEDILLVVAGGEAGRFSACIPGWGSLHYCRSVTRPLNQATCDT